MDERSPTALLVIRAWREDGSESPLRAQIRLTADVSAGFERTLSLSDVEQMIGTVRAFLGDVLAHPTEELRR